MSYVYSDLIRDVRLKGKSRGEGVLAAALAGYLVRPEQIGIALPNNARNLTRG